MGTSSSYSGPTRRPPLLPPWAEQPLPSEPVLTPEPGQPPPPFDGQPDPNPDVVPLPHLAPPPFPTTWRGPKTAVGRVAGGGGSAALASAARSYVRSSGGARGAAGTAVSGRRSTSGLGSFLGSVAGGGIVQAAAALGLTNLLGRDAQFVLAAFIDLLAPAGDIREEAIARKAVIDTLSELFDRFDVEQRGIEALDNMTGDDVGSIVALSITNYVNARFQQELVNRIERGAVSERDANVFATQIREYIETNVRLDIRGVNVLLIDWNGPEGTAFVDQQYVRAYDLLGGTS